MIKTMKNNEGLWAAIHDESPIMTVVGDTEEIVRSIVERNLVWYAERQAAKVIAAEAEVIDIPSKREPDLGTSDSSGIDESSYMSGC